MQTSEKEDERLKKLIERTIEPLPHYSNEANNRIMRMSLEGSSSEYKDQMINEVHSERKNKKIIDIDKKPINTQPKKEENSHQTTLDAFNFAIVPQIHKKQVKRVLSDCERLGPESNSLSNNSSQEARGVLFTNGHSQKVKIDEFYGTPANGNDIGANIHDGYLDYITREKKELSQVRIHARRDEKVGRYNSI